MRTDLSAGTLALLASGKYDVHWQFFAANGSGTLVDLSGRLEVVSGALPNPDAPIGTLDIEFLRTPNDDGSISLAPLMGASILNRLDDGTTYSPLLQVGRDVLLKVALTARGGARPGSGYYEVFGGKITAVASPEQFGNVRISCADRSGKLQRTKSEATYTYAAGTSVEAAIQAVLNNNSFSSITLSTPVATGKVLSLAYAPGKQKTVWEQIWALAQSIGWVVWWRYNSSGVAQLTLFEPIRTKSTADLTLPVIRKITQLEINEEEIANVLYGEFLSTSNVRTTVGPVENTTSISKYGGVRRVAWLIEANDSPVRSSSDMTALLSAAVLDVGDPDALQSAVVPLFIFGEVSVDLYTFAANDLLFDSDQKFAPFAIRFEHRIGEDHQSTLQVRGKPTGGAKTWAARRTAGVSTAAPGVPDGVIVPKWDMVAATASATVTGNENVASIKIVASTSGPPSATAVRAASAINASSASPALVGTLASSIAVGTVVYFAAFLYSGTSGAGTESQLVTAQAVFGVGTAGIGVGAVTPTQMTVSILSAVTANLGTVTAGIARSSDSRFYIDFNNSLITITDASAVARVRIGLFSGTYGAWIYDASGNVIVGPTGLGSNTVGTSQYQPGSVVASKLTESSRGFGSTVLFSASSYTTVNWSAGTITLADGTSYSISSGSTGAMGVETFIYFDPSVSTTALQSTTSMPTATGERRLMICYARPSGDTSQRAMYVPAVGVVGLNSDNVQINSINANHITGINLSVIQAVVTSLSAVTANLGSVVVDGNSGALITLKASGTTVGTFRGFVDGLGNRVELVAGTSYFYMFTNSVTWIGGGLRVKSGGLTVEGASSTDIQGQLLASGGLISQGTFDVTGGAASTFSGNVTLADSKELRLGYSGGFWNLNSGNGLTELNFSYNTAPKAKVDSSGNFYIKGSYLTFSPEPPKPVGLMTARDWLAWGTRDALRENWPDADLPTPRHPRILAMAKTDGLSVDQVLARETARYGKDVGVMAWGAAGYLRLLDRALRNATSFEELHAALA